VKRVCIQSEDALSRMCEQVSKHKEIGLDYETRPGWWVNKPPLAGVGMAVHEDNGYTGWYVPVGHDIGLLDKHNLPVGLVLSKIKPILENQKIRKVAHGAEIESGLSKVNGIEMGTSVRCSQITTWLYDEETWLTYPRQLRLKEIVPVLLGRPIKTVEEHMGGKVKDYGTIPIDVMTLYNTDDSIHGLMLHEWCEPELRRQGLWDDYTEIEIPLVGILRDMQLRGIQIDMVETYRQLSAAEERQKVLEGLIYREAGRAFNIGSRDTLAKIIIEELGYPEMLVPNGRDPVTKEPTMIPYRTATGKYKTDDAAMQHYAGIGCPLARFYTEHGDLEKKRGTDLMKFVDGVDQGDRFHATFWQCGTKSGRFSGNLQQTPRDIFFFCPKCGRFGAGSTIENLYTCSCGRKTATAELILKKLFIDIRRLVIACAGSRLIVADYNQLELRLIAHYSQDPVLVGAYCRGEDLHQGTAELLNISRADAKPVNFGLAYGLSLYSLIELFGEEKARECFPLLRQRYKVLLKYTAAVIAAAHETEDIRTIAWRKRRLPHINTGDQYTRGHQERQAFNSKCGQGTAADIVKMAQRNLARSVPEFRQVLQVHDEIIGEVENKSEKYCKQVMAAVKEVMENVVKLMVPLVCDPKLVDNWREGK
jgi:DNA polymerase I